VLRFQSEGPVTDISFVSRVGVQYTDFLPLQIIITTKSPSPLTLIVLCLEMAKVSHQKLNVGPVNMNQQASIYLSFQNMNFLLTDSQKPM